MVLRGYHLSRRGYHLHPQNQHDPQATMGLTPSLELKTTEGPESELNLPHRLCFLLQKFQNLRVQEISACLE